MSKPPFKQVASNLIEAGEDALVLNSGYFGDSFADCLETYGARVTQLKADVGAAPTPADVETCGFFSGAVPPNSIGLTIFMQGVLSDAKGICDIVKRVSPDTLVILDGVCSVASEEIRFDEWGIDVVLTATQKGLGTPPGLSVLCVSQKALKVFETRRSPPSSYYASWKRWLPIMKAYESGTAQYFATPPVNLIYAFNASLQAITRAAPSLEDRFTMHKEASQRLKKALEDLGLRQVPLDPAFAANGMTAVYYPDGLVASDVLPKLVKDEIVVAAGLHKEIKDKYFRIGHMGLSVVDPSRGDLDRVITSLQHIFG
ncbi:hypothetical protein FRC00_005540 [Tulasnella sp. 408]|nr:hypothetical protein FRC00_005540 [Tulasnella sp. 408]